MENIYSTEVNYLSFFEDSKAKKLFSKLDYFLRSGVHIQREYPKPAEIFRFLEKHYESLQIYYWEFFNILLTQSGNDFERYYYLDFFEGNKGGIPSDHKEYLKTEHVIVGMLFLKLFKVDGNIELDSVAKFSEMVLIEYEDDREALTKRLAHSSSTKSTDRNDEIVKKTISEAFKKFGKLGWIEWLDPDTEHFGYLPSFERLREMYATQIQMVDELIRDNESDEK